MDQNTRNQIDWQQPFPHEEYYARQNRVRVALKAHGYTGILISSPPDLNYLFGYDHIWFSHDSLGVCFLPADEDEFVFFDNDGHEMLVSIYPEIANIVYFRRGKVADHIKVIASEVLRRGWAQGAIALQSRCYGPHPDHLRAIGRVWQDAGGEIADGSDLIEDIRLIKSGREIKVMREAAEIAVAAMSLARDSISVGMRETDLEAVIVGEMMRRGGGYPGIRTMIGGGPRAGVHHEPPSHRKFRNGDVIHIDFCASLHRYHVNICRSFALGEVDPRWINLFERSEPMMDVIVAEIRPGDSMTKMQDLADAFAQEHDLARYEWLIGGYSLGIAMPPDWVGRHRPRPREDIPPPELAPGLVMNFENQYDVLEEDWSGAAGAGLIDTLLVGDKSLEILTPLSRKLAQVG
ncbi:MAG: Xaa-Pro peptidase family protein [Gammaproteobacteria bacterium]|nr:Xaa-Pro peptidase family protein [Gammaproteobacteria bacterium]